MAAAVTTLREINQFATIRQICNQFGIEQEELEQSIIEDAFSVYAFLSLSDGTTTVEYDEDGNECKPQAGNLGFMPSDHYLLSREAAAAIVRDGSLTSNMVFEDFHLKKEFTVKKEYLRIKIQDVKDLLNPPAPADKSFEMDAAAFSDLVDSDNPYLSQKLEAANKTLLHLQDHGTNGKNIKAAAKAFI